MILKEDDFPIPSEADLRKAIDKSGYIFELQLCPVFEDFNFIADSCSCFQDQDTGKTREIDIYAYQHDLINERWHPKEDGLIISDIIRTDIIAECKNNRAAVIFFTRRPYLGNFGNVLIAGNPEYIKHVDGIPDDGVLEIQHFLELEEFHHNWNVTYPAYQFGLMKPKYIAKGSPNETIDWSLTHDDYYDSINKVAKAAISKGLQLYKDSLNVEHNEFYLAFIYPVIIFKDDLFECRINNDSYTIKKTNHLTLEWMLMIANNSFNLNIDVICSSYLPKFLKIINIEKNEVAKRISSKLQQIRKNVSREATSKFKPNS
jgi:hypothetical protein